jgi:hypothetical protein
LLQLAIGSFKFRQSDRFAGCGTVLDPRLDDHPDDCPLIALETINISRNLPEWLPPVLTALNPSKAKT